jgi:hypothetical protein
MATILAFTRKSPAACQPGQPTLLDSRRPRVTSSPTLHLSLDSQIAVAVAHTDEEITRLAARTNIHYLPD